MDENIWVEILKRLPSKTLCRFQSVSTNWKSIISSSFFVNLHHSFTSSSTPYHLKPYLRLLSLFLDPIYIYKIHKFIDLNRPLGDKLNHSIQTLQCPYPATLNGHISTGFTIAGVVRGVVCLFAIWFPDDDYNHHFFLFFQLWNPSIRKYISLPRIPWCKNSFTITGMIGFGYDKSNNDFKVVAVLETHRLRELSYQVYSSRRRSWTPVLKTPPINDTDERTWNLYNSSCFVNGSVHWMVEDYFADQYLVRFDCETDEWREWVKIEMEDVYFGLNQVNLVEGICWDGWSVSEPLTFFDGPLGDGGR